MTNRRIGIFLLLAVCAVTVIALLRWLYKVGAWQMCMDAGRVYVFCRITRHGDDKPIRGTDIYAIIQKTSTLAGVEFKPHDLRRTLITEALATGTPLATVQAAAGHARGETTLRYAQAVDARQARKMLKLRYG